MTSVSGISTISKVFTKLGDNTGSLIPMYAKDFTSDTFSSVTYYKHGGSRDFAEKTFEEFGTGIVWLGAIPFLKKHLFDNFLYKKANMNPDIDAKRLFSGSDSNIVDTVEFAKNKAKSLGDAFSEQADILEDAVKRKDFAKKLSLGKFGFSTAAAGLAVFGLITYKQKNTEKKIKEQVQKKHEMDTYNKKAIENTRVYNMFSKKESKNPAFKGISNIGTFFMTNPVANTSIIDGVISGTRLSRARKGEIPEVALKEFGEPAIIYGLALPLETGMEYAGKKFFKRPIDLNYGVLDSMQIKNAIDAEKAQKGSSALLQQAKKVVELASENSSKDKATVNKTSKKIIDYVFKNSESDLAEVFKKNGDISVFKTKDGVEQLSLLSSINVNKLKKTAQHTIEIIENAVKEGGSAKYLKQSKILKGASIIGNILISTILIGCMLPELTILLRKKINNGDKTNPAIINLANEIERNVAFQGTLGIKKA